MKKYSDNYSSANQNRHTITTADRDHDRKLIEDSFHSGIAPKAKVEGFFKKYGTQH